ncbi:hypothetical protein Agabi119p4_2390 [Agaricus bisporus var. burnettii]|uniref:Uncharacterized protein n=1 Tax=Agaricus bisporus var. burnettii TaxID=192524 RepID=A0A8H7KJX3_AGABI|nr:hypothetical protein Agabi119p4_2390 [Agaricus bisporus var. burnettii]
MKKPRKRHTPPQDDNGLSSGTSNALVPFSPPPRVDLSPTNRPREASPKEGRAREGRASQQDAERVAAAMEHVTTSHPDPEGNDNGWREKAEKFRMADPKDRGRGGTPSRRRHLEWGWVRVKGSRGGGGWQGQSTTLGMLPHLRLRNPKQTLSKKNPAHCCSIYQ